MTKRRPTSQTRDCIEMAERVGPSVFNNIPFIFSVLQFYAARFLYLTSTPNSEHRAFTRMIQPQILFAIPDPSRLIQRGMNQPRMMPPRRHVPSFEEVGGTISRTLIAGWVAVHRPAPRMGWGCTETWCSEKVLLMDNK